jgi:hypothetical protein
MESSSISVHETRRDRLATGLTQATVAPAVPCSAKSIPSAFTSTSARHANCPGTPGRDLQVAASEGVYETDTRARRTDGPVVRVAVAGVGCNVGQPMCMSRGESSSCGCPRDSHLKGALHETFRPCSASWQAKSPDRLAANHHESYPPPVRARPAPRGRSRVGSICRAPRELA